MSVEDSLHLLNTCEVLAVDTETTPIIDGHVPDLVGISIYGKIGSVAHSIYLPFGHIPMIEGMAEPENLPVGMLDNIDEILQDKILIFHNAKFDMAVLEQAGLSRFLGSDIYCTMVMSAMLNENGDYSKKANNGLEVVAKKYGFPVFQQDKIKQLGKKLKTYAKIPIQIMAPYAQEDVQLTYGVYPFLAADLTKQSMDHLVKKEMEFMRVLYSIERVGVAVDVQKCHTFSRAAQLRLKEIRDEIGFDPAKPYDLAHHLYAPKPQGLGLPIVERGQRANEEFPDGVPLAGKPLLLPYAHLPLVSTVLEYRGHQKAVSTWFDGFVQKLGPDGRLHPEYRQAATRTGRLSCSGPNLQQIPRTTEEEREQGVSKSMVKELFLADEGDDLWEFDYSQMELRLGAVYGKDESMLDVFRSGGDLHQLTADKLGISRQAGKTLNLALQYGAGGAKIALMLGIEEDEGYKLVQEYWAAYPGLANIKAIAAQKAAQAGYVRYWTGKRRHFPDSNDSYKAFNSIVQGGAGEIVKHSMLMLHYKQLGNKMVNQVHDSIWNMIPQGDEEMAEEIKSIMEWPGEKFGIPFPVDIKVLARSC